MFRSGSGLSANVAECQGGGSGNCKSRAPKKEQQSTKERAAEHQRKSSRASETQLQSIRDCKSSVRVQRQHCILREGAFLIPLSVLPSGTELEGEEC